MSEPGPGSVPAGTGPISFSTAALVWRPRDRNETHAAIADAEGDAAPFFPLLLAGAGAGAGTPDDQLAALTRAQSALARRRGPGLAAGERDLVATAVSRRIGCFFTAAAHARRAAAGLRRKREVEVLLEEGLPCPLTGRLGAAIDAASALTAIPVKASRKLFWRLEEEKFDDQEIVDLVLMAAFANWNARLSLAWGQSQKPRR